MPPALAIGPTTRLVAYSAVVDIPGATESELYRRARAWALRRDRGDTAVLQMQDVATGKIIVKGRTQALVNGHNCGPGAMCSASASSKKGSTSTK
jgi:hypothetical protein